MTEKKVPVWETSVQPWHGERVGEWKARFMEKNNKRPPSTLDYRTHNQFHCIKLTAPDSSKETQRMIRECVELCGEVFDPLDWDLTYDLRLWLSNDDQVITFKLSWPW